MRISKELWAMLRPKRVLPLWVRQGLCRMLRIESQINKGQGYDLPLVYLALHAVFVASCRNGQMWFGGCGHGILAVAGGTSVNIVVYRITGAQGWFRVPHWVCPECDLTVAAVRQACREVGILPDAVIVRPWLVFLTEAWRAGAHHPPAVLINGRLYSQERVPEVAQLVHMLRQVKDGERGGISSEF